MKILTPSYLNKNYTDSLRYELCDMLYNDYKGTTFFLNQQLVQKKAVLSNIYEFFKEHPEISEYKGSSKYWYPYENVDGTQNFSLFGDFYPNTNGGITYFCKENEQNFIISDYMHDPVKLHFFLMCNDIKKMDCHSDIAKEIIQINNELFKLLFEKVGDVISYNGKNTLEHIQEYIQNHLDEEEKIKNDSLSSYSQDYKNLLLRSCRSFNDFSYLLNEAIIICQENKLQYELSTKKDPKKIKQKI